MTEMNISTYKNICTVNLKVSLDKAITGGDDSSDTATERDNTRILACLVADTGSVHDKGYNQIAYKGVQDAEATLGVRIDLLESASAADYAPNLHDFADKGCNIIVTVGFLLGDAAKAAAEANPDKNYVIVDSVFDPPIANARGLVFATEQPTFMAGYLAAGMSKTGVVGTFGGINIPTVSIIMDSFVKGVAYYNAQKGTKVKVLGWDTTKKDGTFAGNFQSLDDGQNIAKSQADKGADIIFPVAGAVGLGSAQFAMESGSKIKIIGIDVDMSISNPDAASVYIASVLKNTDAAVLAAITDIVNGVKTSDNYVGTLTNGGVGFAYTAVPSELQAEIDAIGKSIADGTIKI